MGGVQHTCPGLRPGGRRRGSGQRGACRLRKGTSTSTGPVTRQAPLQAELARLQCKVVGNPFACLLVPPVRYTDLLVPEVILIVPLKYIFRSLPALQLVIVMANVQK